jgi:hypothetical protein
MRACCLVSRQVKGPAIAMVTVPRMRVPTQIPKIFFSSYLFPFLLDLHVLDELTKFYFKLSSPPFSDSCLPDKKAMAVPTILEVKKILIKL